MLVKRVHQFFPRIQIIPAKKSLRIFYQKRMNKRIGGAKLYSSPCAYYYCLRYSIIYTSLRRRSASTALRPSRRRRSRHGCPLCSQGQIDRASSRRGAPHHPHGAGEREGPRHRRQPPGYRPAASFGGGGGRDGRTGSPRRLGLGSRPSRPGGGDAGGGGRVFNFSPLYWSD